MSFIAEAELVIDAPVEEIFDRLADFASWSSWMPRSFVPVMRSGSPTTLRHGARFFVKIAGMPVASPLRISVHDRPRELTWRGGPRGVLHAEHRFVFEPAGNGTRVRSIETWSGVLARVSRRFVKPKAEKVGGQQLASLARAMARETT